MSEMIVRIRSAVNFFKSVNGYSIQKDSLKNYFDSTVKQKDHRTTNMFIHDRVDNHGNTLDL